MCDCVPFALLPYPCNKTSKLGLTRFDWRPRIRYIGLQFDRGTSRPNGVELHILKSLNCVNASRNPRVSGYQDYEDYDGLGFKEKGEKRFEFETSEGEAAFEKLRKQKNGVDDISSSDDISVSSRFEDEKGDRESVRGLKDADVVNIEDVDGVDSKLEELEKLNGREGLRRRRQTMMRSSMLAKQVISIQSALNLGFVSQLWVDTSSVSNTVILILNVLCSHFWNQEPS